MCLVISDKRVTSYYLLPMLLFTGQEGRKMDAMPSRHHPSSLFRLKPFQLLEPLRSLCCARNSVLNG